MTNLKKIFFFTLFLTVILSCNRNKKVNDTELKGIIDKKNKQIKKATQTPNTKKSINLYNYFLEKIIYEKNLNKLYYPLTESKFNTLIERKKIKTITNLKGNNGYKITSFYYHDSIANKVYDKILNLNKKKIEEYHDFFKSGKCFILTKNKTELIMINFNPFLNNELPKKTKTILISNKEIYQKAFISVGIGNIEEFKN